MGPTEIANFLNGTGQTILGVVFGSAAVIIGQAVNAGATRKASKLSSDASRESNDVSVTNAETAATIQMKAALLNASLDAYKEFHSQMVEWEISTRDECTLGHGEVPERDAYAGWIISEEWRAKLLLGRLTAVTSDPFPNHAESVQSAGLNALRAHEHNFHTTKENNQEVRHESEQARITALEGFRTMLADLPIRLRETLQIDKGS